MNKFMEIVIIKKLGSDMNDSLSKYLHFILLCFEVCKNNSKITIVSYICA